MTNVLSTQTNLKILNRDDFVFGKFLGRGKFSDVYISKCKKTGFTFAIKIMYFSQLQTHNMLS